MIVHGFICTKCRTFVFSRSRHDFAACNCREAFSFMDGGQDNKYGGGYTRAGGEPGSMLWGTMELPEVDEHDLFRDWNTGKDTFVRIPVTDKEIELWQERERTMRPTLRTGA